jgi:hypothetical protein
VLTRIENEFSTTRWAANILTTGRPLKLSPHYLQQPFICAADTRAQHLDFHADLLGICARLYSFLCESAVETRQTNTNTAAAAGVDIKGFSQILTCRLTAAAPHPSRVCTHRSALRACIITESDEKSDAYA